jgi:hypothetical protein
MEREERYKSGVVRTLVVIGMVSVLFFGAGFWVLHRQQQATERAEAEAEQAALLAEAARLRAEYAADSTAAAGRLADFRHNYEVEELEGAPIFLVPIPGNKSVQRFIDQVWSDYMRVMDPDVSDEAIRHGFDLRYINIMNRATYNSRGRIVWNGEMRPTAVVLPSMKQRGTELDFEKPSFAQIIRGQESAGVRIIEEEEMLEEPAEGAPAISQNMPDAGESEAVEEPPAESDEQAPPSEQSP